MKIAFPLLNQTQLAVDFVHSQYLGIFDVENDKIEVLSFEGVEKKLAVVNFFEVMTSAGLSSVVSPYYSFMALRVFKENNIGTFKAEGTDLQKNILFYKANRLKSFDRGR
jgi:predicted Fe-Mo cluster-binding NifX family protein